MKAMRVHLMGGPQDGRELLIKPPLPVALRMPDLPRAVAVAERENAGDLDVHMPRYLYTRVPNIMPPRYRYDPPRPPPQEPSHP